MGSPFDFAESSIKIELDVVTTEEGLTKVQGPGGAYFGVVYRTKRKISTISDDDLFVLFDMTGGNNNV